MTGFDEPAFCRLIDAVLPGGGWVVAIHHVYFDESGTHEGSPMMTVAGYIFRDEQARRFTRDWSKDLKRLGLPFAHMTDCATGNGAYSEMSLDDRVKSERLLIEHIKRRTIVGFGVSLDPNYYLKTVQGAFQPPSPYSFCLLGAVSMVRGWIERTGFDGKIAYFFEAGHRHQTEANRLMNGIPAGGPVRMAKYCYLSHTFIDKTEAPPLQAADMLAWQHCHYHVRRLKGHDRIRADFEALIRPQDMARDYTRASIDLFRQGLGEAHEIFPGMTEEEIEAAI